MSKVKNKPLTKIEIQAILDAMLFTQDRTIVSNAHVRAFRKIKRRIKHG